MRLLPGLFAQAGIVWIAASAAIPWAAFRVRRPRPDTSRRPGIDNGGGRG
jgi:hypothetical protein